MSGCFFASFLFIDSLLSSFQFGVFIKAAGLVNKAGYISKELFKALFDSGLRMVTSLRKTMKPQIVTLADSAMISNRSLIESAFNVLKNSMHLEHSRHRSVANFMVNLLSTLSAFAMRGMSGSSFKKQCMPALGT